MSSRTLRTQVFRVRSNLSNRTQIIFLRTRTLEPNCSKKNFELELICRTVRKSKNKVKNTFLNERFNTPFRFCDDGSWGSGHSIFIFFLPLSISNGLLLMWKLFFLWLCISFICVTLIYELTFFEERTPFRFFSWKKIRKRKFFLSPGDFCDFFFIHTIDTKAEKKKRNQNNGRNKNYGSTNGNPFWHKWIQTNNKKSWQQKTKQTERNKF